MYFYFAESYATSQTPSGLAYNWLINFKDRGHVNRYRGMQSTLAPINASIVQGSDLGPTAL